MPSSNSQSSLLILAFLLLIVMSGLLSIGLCLLLGIVYALSVKNPFRKKTDLLSAFILKASIVVMGFGLNINKIIQTSLDNLLVTIITIVLALILGLLLGKVLKVNHKLSFLITSGTAICGGSAIAALAPAIRANSTQLVTAITVVFLLNGIGLIAYPEIGNYLSLSQSEFGLWAALGIHDTSSVVGAAVTYGEEALNVATSTKLARALWIIPLVFVSSIYFKSDTKSAPFPWFILIFLLASLLASFCPPISSISAYAPLIAKKGMAISLFLLGAGITRSTIKEINLAALWQGITLWLLISLTALWLVKSL